MERFIIPLREMIPWKPFTPKWLYANMKNPPINLKDVVGNGLIYIGRYYFPTLEGGQRFVESVKQIGREEKHDPSILRNYTVGDKLGNSPEAVECVYIRINTHEAYIPKEVLSFQPNHYPAKHVTPFPETLLVPGLTIRDVRFAMLVDELYRNHFTDSFPSYVMKPQKDPLTVQKLFYRIFRYRFCPCCGLPHTLRECTMRDQYKPRDGEDWVVDGDRWGKKIS